MTIVNISLRLPKYSRLPCHILRQDFPWPIYSNISGTRSLLLDKEKGDRTKRWRDREWLREGGETRWTKDRKIQKQNLSNLGGQLLSLSIGYQIIALATCELIIYWCTNLVNYKLLVFCFYWVGGCCDGRPWGGQSL